MEKKEVESETTYNSIMDVIFGEEGQTYTIKGVVTSPKDLLVQTVFIFKTRFRD